MNAQSLSYLESELNCPIRSVKALSGGDISRAYMIKADRDYFLKVNDDFNILEAESYSLELLRTANVNVPEVIICKKLENEAFLLMEFITEGPKRQFSYEQLAKELIKCHRVTNDDFGLMKDNFLGTLYQQNSPSQHWIDFYVKNRLIPQFKLARNQHFLMKNEIPLEEKVEKILEGMMPDIEPVLLHGDFWGGNYLVGKDKVYLIDPSSYYGHYEVDLAMSMLFGGFEEQFYNTYFDVGNRREHGMEERVDIYQLYYLLAHLNMFGLAYKENVNAIIKRFFW